MAMARAASRKGLDLSRMKDIVSGGDLAGLGVSFVGINLGNAIQGLGADQPEEDRKFFHKHTTLLITGGLATAGAVGYCYGMAPEFTSTLFLTSGILALNEISKKFWDSSSLLKPGARTVLVSKSQLQAMKAVQSGRLVPSGHIQERVAQLRAGQSGARAGRPVAASILEM